MNVSAACPPALTDRPYLALLKLMNILKVQCSIIMTLIFSDILKLKYCHRSLFKSYCRSLLNQGQTSKLKRNIKHHLLTFSINYQAQLCHYFQSHATVFVFYSLVAGKASCWGSLGILMCGGMAVTSTFVTFIATPSGKFRWTYSRKVLAVESVRCRNCMKRKYVRISYCTRCFL